MNSFGQPTHGAEPPPVEDASPQDEATDPPREQDLIWPLVLALRDLGGSAHKTDINQRVAVLLELTEEQTAIEIPSGGIAKLQNRLDWAGHKLKQLGIVTYPSRGHRELTPRGQTITESQLDALIRGTTLTGASATPAGDLTAAVEQFRRDTGYPTDADDEQKRLREEWREKLLPDNIESLSRHDLIAVVWNGTFGSERYVCPPDELPSVRVRWVERLDDESFAGLLGHIQYLCWGEDDPWIRYAALTDRSSQRYTNNFRDAATSKVLAICHPETFLPVGVSYGKGRDAMLQKLGLPPARGTTHGQRVVEANDRLREHLAPYFDDDLYGMATFLYWLMDEEQGPPPPPPPPPAWPDLNELANRLLVNVEFLEDIFDLLKDKGQVILYGPPGTGTTYLAQELAKELALDESCRTLVQFHPSTSYEDFFEGYRPAGTGADGGISFKLMPGPLARMAERAAEEPEQRHIMVIDEINRGNLPRVLGELLFLLEYRGESVLTLYRPDEPFSLPKNLWFIGTMNTADRSIALVDAALRRRFHFVPFFPDSGAMEGLLGRWLARENEPAWVGRLVDAVNAELRGDLEGSDLLLGPSHFMKEYGSTPEEQQKRLRRIWKYNIEPFIADQFYGDPDRIQHYRFADVLARHGPAAGSGGAADLDADATPATPADTAEESTAAGADDEVNKVGAATEADPQ